MIPEKEQGPVLGDSAVAVEDEAKSQAPVGDSTPGRASTPDENVDQATAEATRPAEGKQAYSDGSPTPGANGPDGQDSPVDEGASQGTGAGGDSVKKAEFQEVSDTPAKDQPANLDLLLDVVVPVSVELGRTSLTVKDILSTCQGSVIELGRTAGEPVDIMVGGKPLARGEVVVVKDRFGVRITELVGSIEGVSKA